MTREIKFRAWDKEDKKMFFNVQNAYDTLEHHCLHEEDCIKDECRLNPNSFGSVLQNFRYEVMQFTGLHDKNGKEIYEGDIIAERNLVKNTLVNHQAVKWQEDESGFYPFADSPENCGCCGGGERSNRWEVAGNIYENPNLLTNN